MGPAADAGVENRARWSRASRLAPVWAWALVVLAVGTFARADDEAAPVEVVRSEERRLEEELPVTGTVTSERVAALSPRVSGLVTVVHVDAGSRVEEGQVLLELDDELARLALERARASAEESEARLGESERLREEAITLLRRRTIAQTEADARQAASRIASAEARRLEVEVREQEERVERHTLTAPFDGVVSRRLADPGEWVETGTPVFELVEVDRVRLDVRVPQERFAEIGLDTPVSIRLDSHPAVDIPARVAAKVPVADSDARTFLVRIAVDDRPAFMTPGISGRALFRLRRDEPVVVVPRDAVIRTVHGSNTVWLVAENGAARRAASREVRLGRASGDLVEVLEGLPAGVPVVVRGNEALQEGRAVRIVDGSATEADASRKRTGTES